MKPAASRLVRLPFQALSVISDSPRAWQTLLNSSTTMSLSFSSLLLSRTMLAASSWSLSLAAIVLRFYRSISFGLLDNFAVSPLDNASIKYKTNISGPLIPRSSKPDLALTLPRFFYYCFCWQSLLFYKIPQKPARGGNKLKLPSMSLVRFWTTFFGNITLTTKEGNKRWYWVRLLLTSQFLMWLKNANFC